MDRKKRKKKAEKYSRLALKRGTEAGKTVIRTRLIVIGIILLIITVGIVVTIQLFPLTTLNGGDGGELPYVPTAPSAPYFDEIIPNPDPDGNIDLTWSTVSGATQYAVFFRPSGGTWISIRTTSSTSCSYNAGLSDGTYYFKIMASNAYGESPYSNPQSVVVYDPPDPVPVPSAPNLDEIIANPDYNGDIYLEWSTVSGVYGYKVYFRAQESSTWTPVGTTSSNSYYFEAGLSNGLYEFTVTAYKDGIESPYSNIVSVEVADPPQPVLDLPTDPSISINSGNKTTNSLDVILTLGCDNANEMRFKTSVDGTWTSYEPFQTTKSFHLSDAYEGSVYKVFVQFSNADGPTDPDSTSDYITYEVDETLLPQSPSIKINDGNSTTDSFEVTLTLGCENANEMCFKLVGETGWTDWTDWEPYNIVWDITLIENSTLAPLHVVKVKFQNDKGESEIVFDNIYYGEMPEPEIPTEQIVIMVVVSIAFIGATILILQYSKKMKQRKRIKRKINSK